MDERWFSLLLLVVILQRLGEIILAKRNEEKIRSFGGYERGRAHYKYIVLLHILFFISMLWEAARNGITPPPWWMITLLVWLFAQLFRYWVIRTLGIFWNTRIMVLPGAKKVVTGPYRWFRHPNYAVVTLELLVIPLIFGLYFTAVVFPLINMIFLESVRIPAEEKALHQAAKEMAETEPDDTVSPYDSARSRSGRPVS